MDYEAFIKQTLEEIHIPYPITESTQKSPRELVTTTDKELEEQIKNKIQQTYPEHGIRGEEGTNIRETSEYQWVIDPIDGTTNYVHQIPLFCTAIALLKNNTVLAAGVRTHITNNLYLATKGRGATKNGVRIQAKKQVLSEGIIGFCHANDKEAITTISNLYETYKKHTRDFRRLGSANLELCMVAEGMLAGFIGYRIQPWDFLPGCLIAVEAGCSVTGWNEETWQHPDTKSIRASAPETQILI